MTTLEGRVRAVAEAGQAQLARHLALCAEDPAVCIVTYTAAASTGRW